MNNKKLRHVKLFETFDLTARVNEDDSKLKKVKLKASDSQNKKIYSILQEIMKTSEEIEKEMPKYEILVDTVEKEIEKMTKEFKKKQKQLMGSLDPYKEKMDKLKIMKEEVMGILGPYSPKLIEVKDTVAEIDKVLIEKGVYNKDGEPKTTYSWRAIAELTEKLVPINEANKEALAEIKKQNASQKLDVYKDMITKVYKKGTNESVVNEGVIDWIKDAAKKVGDWFKDTFGGLLGLKDDIDNAVESSKEALALAKELK